MRILTLNCNGIRSAHRKGFYDWLATQDTDVVCLQELKSEEKDFPAEMVRGLGYHVLAAYQRTYNGVAILSREPPSEIGRASCRERV